MAVLPFIDHVSKANEQRCVTCYKEHSTLISGHYIKSFMNTKYQWPLVPPAPDMPASLWGILMQWFPAPCD